VRGDGAESSRELSVRLGEQFPQKIGSTIEELYLPHFILEDNKLDGNYLMKAGCIFVL
jgi:hypothetical protein